MTNSSRRDPRHQIAESIREEAFQRRMRGLDADQVYAYLDLLADQVQATERELGDARTENERLSADLRRAQAQLEEHEQAGHRVNEQVVQMFSQAQLVAEEMVADVSRDARERISQARAREHEMAEEARSSAGQQVNTYARAAQTEMQSIMESFAAEIDRIGRSAVSGDSAVDSGDWRNRDR